MSRVYSLFKGDRVVWIIFAILCIVSLIEVYSASSTLTYKSHTTMGPILKHALFLILGTVLVVFLHNFSYRYATMLGFATLFIAVVLLILTPIIGVRLNDASRWIELFGIQFQPSEFAKLSMVILTSFILSRCQTSLEQRNMAFWIILGMTAAFAILIFSENLSTALLLCVVVYILLFFGRVPSGKLFRLALIVVAAGALFLILLYFIPKIDGLNRWETWHNRMFQHEPTVMEQGFEISKRNFQPSHAKMAIANGGFLGVFPGNSTQRDYLPQAYSDFIYAIIIEEMGWIGAILIPGLYLMLMYRGLRIAKKCTKVYPMLLVMGSTIIIGLQAFVNMLVAVGAGPVTGQPMPLISRGGTSTVITCIYFGIILSVSRFGVSDTMPDVPSSPEEMAVEEQELETAKEYGV
jgi:cell division protein FtsW